MRKIWGRLTSVNVQKVVWACEEMGLPYQRLDVGGAYGGNRTPEYLAMNPNGLIPVLEEEDGYTLWESHAILRYLAEAYPSGLWPLDARGRGKLDRWMDWHHTALGEPMRIIFWGLVRTPPEKRDMEAITRAASEAGAKWAMLEAEFADKYFLGGEALSLADIPLGCFAHRWFNLPVERPHLPAVQAWYERLLERPGYAQYVARPLE